MIDMLFKKKDIINDIISRYSIDPEGAIKYIDVCRSSKEYKYDDRRLADLKRILTTALNVGYRQGMKR